MKKVNKFVIVFLVLLLFFSAVGTAQPDDIKIRFQIKNTGFDTNQNMYTEHVNISVNAPGNLVYVEEYYTIDSNRNPKYSGSGRYEAGQGIKSGIWYNASIDTFRPLPRSGKSYSLIKSVILLDNNRIFEYWLTRNVDFIDNTDNSDDSTDAALSEIQNIEQFEVKENKIVANIPVTFEYSSLGIVDRVNVTGMRNDDLNLRIDLLKGVSSLTYNPGGVVYKYLELKADSPNIKNISIFYHVANYWMNNRSILPKNVIMVAWDSDNKVWVPLHTTVIDNDTDFTYYESESNMPSKFAILGLKSVKPKATTQQNTTKPIKTTPTLNQSKDDAVKTAPGLSAVVAVIALLYISKKGR